MIYFPFAQKHYGPCGVVAKLEPCAYRPCVHGKIIASKYAMVIVLLISILFSFASLSRIENISIICIEETSNKQIVEEAASNDRVYLQKTGPGTLDTGYKPRNIRKSQTLLKTKKKNSLE